MPTGVYLRSLVRSKWKEGKELIDLTEASKILCLSVTGLHWQIRKKGALKLQEFCSRRWWVLKIDVLELKDRWEEEAKESAEASREHHKQKMKEWHDRMTKEGRCHWCGAPASKKFKNACPKHVEAARAASRSSKEKIKAASKAKSLCVSCNIRPQRFGYETCSVCGNKHALDNRKRREARTLQKTDELIDKGLITVDEAAEILGVHRVRVHNAFINKGILKVREYAFRRFYLSETDVQALKKSITRG